MKYNKLMLTTLLGGVLLMASCGKSSRENGTNTVENSTQENSKVTGKTHPISGENSEVIWTGTMLGMYSHTGTISILNGEIELEGSELVGGNVVIDMKSITPTDNGYKDAEGSRKEDLVNHLNSPVFFDIGNNPTASFRINSVEDANASGILNIRGTEGEEVLNNIVISENEGVRTLIADLTFDRKKYGAIFDMTIPDMVLSDDINLNIRLVY